MKIPEFIKALFLDFKKKLYKPKYSKYPKIINQANFRDKIKGYNKLKSPKFEEHQILDRRTGWIKKKVGNKKVKYWKLVRIDDNESYNDEYVPIYFKK